MITTIDIPAKCLEHLRRGEFDEALMLSKLVDGLELSAVQSDGGIDGDNFIWMVCDQRGGILYEECEDEREARILALWHSLDGKVTFEDIVIKAMGKHYINGVRVDNDGRMSWDEPEDTVKLCPNCQRYLTDQADCPVCDYAW